MLLTLMLSVTSLAQASVAGETATFTVKDDGWPTGFRAAAKANVFVVGAKDIRIWNGKQWSEVPSGVRPGRVHAKRVVASDVSDDGRVALINDATKISVLSEGRLIAHPGPEFGRFSSCVLAPDGSEYSVFISDLVATYKVGGRKSLRQYRIPSVLGYPAISKDTTKLAYIGLGSRASLVLVGPPKSEVELPNTNQVRVAAISVDGERVLLEDKDRKLKLFDFEGRLLAEQPLTQRSLQWNGQYNGAERLQFRRDGEMAAILAEDETVSLFKVGDKSLTPSTKVSAPAGWKLRGIQFTYESKLAVLMSSGRTYKIVTYNVAK